MTRGTIAIDIRANGMKSILPVTCIEYARPGRMNTRYRYTGGTFPPRDEISASFITLSSNCHHLDVSKMIICLK